MKILILGCGNVGANVARQLVPSQPDIQFVIADINETTAQQLAADLGSNTSALKVDINDPKSLDAAMAGANLVFNAVGPFYRSAKPVVEAAIRNKINYMDINDDHDVAEELLFKGNYSKRAEAAGIQLIIGCGSTPGLTNVIARMLANSLDEAHSIHLSTVVPFVPQSLSPAVIDHMMHITSGPVIQFENGEYVMKEGWSGRRSVPYKEPFGNMNAYYIGHGETVTLPHFIKGVKEVTNRIGFFPEQGNEIWRSFIEMGFANADPVEGLEISPLQFMARYLPSPAAADALAVDLSKLPRCVGFRIEVEGIRGNSQVNTVLEYHIDMSDPSTEGGTSDPTPICARLALEAFIRGDISGSGVLSPEACLEPESYIRAFVKASGARFISDEKVTTHGLFKN